MADNYLGLAYDPNNSTLAPAMVGPTPQQAAFNAIGSRQAVGATPEQAVATTGRDPYNATNLGIARPRGRRGPGESAF